jgi:predicted nucleic acid-binding protein
LRAIVDAGVLVALVERNEPHHEWAVQQARGVLAPMLTCDSVLSEAFFLLRSTAGGVDALWKMITGGSTQLAFSLAAEPAPVERLMRKYRDRPMSLADASLVRMSEIYPSHLVFTLDHDFRIYRRFQRRVIPLITPQG